MTTASTLQWRPTTAPPAGRYDDIWFLDESTGWAINSNGHILKTTNGGATWMLQQQITSTYLRCLGFASPRIGWVGTTSAARRLFRTTDGGATWTLVGNLPAAAPVKICGLSVVNEQIIYGSGTNVPRDRPGVIKSTDGGATWTAWDMSAQATILIDCYFPDPQHGWVVGGKANVPNPTRADVKPVVLYTADGGATWIDRLAGLGIAFPFGEWGWKIQFLSDQIGFVSLENFSAGAILKTTDGGTTWVRLAVNDPQRNANLEGIGFLDANHGWVGGWGDATGQSGKSSETLDGGQTWRYANEIGKYINRFRFIGSPPTVAYASGQTVYKYSAEPTPIPAAPPGGRPLRVLESDQPVECDDAHSICFHVPAGAQLLQIDVWDRFAAEVGCILKVEKPTPGRWNIPWDFTDSGGNRLAPGHYLYRVTIDEHAESRLALLRRRSAAAVRKRFSAASRRQRFSFEPAAAPRTLSLAALSGQPSPLERLRPAEPRLTPRDEAVFLVQTAAEIEHALLVQYLYAAYSLGGDHIPTQHQQTVSRWRSQIVTIAIQEMAHLVSMQNVLWLLGGPLNLDREDFPFRGDFYPFHFTLEPLTLDSLAKYVAAEMPEISHPTPELQEIICRATQANEQTIVNRVGALFVRIQEVMDQLTDADLRPDTAGSYQAMPLEWISGGDRIVKAVQALAEAKSLLTEIAVQGEGGSMSPTSHFMTFLGIYRELNAIPSLAASRAVPTNPNTAHDPFSDDPELEAGRITDSEARRWAQLGDLRYRMLLAYLLHALHLDRSSGDATWRTELVRWTLWSMQGRGLGGLRSISAHLGTLSQHDPPQLTSDGRRKVAGLPFELPYSLALPPLERDRWRLHLDVLAASESLLGQMTTNPPLVDRLRQIDADVKRLIEQRLGQTPGPVEQPGTGGDGATAKMIQLIRTKRDELGAADRHTNVQYPGLAQTLAELFDELLSGNQDLALLLDTLKSKNSVRDPQGRRLIVPGNPDDSVFYRIVTNADGLVPFMASQFSDADREIVRQWIADMPAETAASPDVNRLSQIEIFLDEAVEGNEIGAHGAFWRGLSREEFVSYKVFGLVQLVQPGDAVNSNLVKALRGSGFPRMPVGYPALPENRIQFIEQWIRDGCPAELSDSVRIDYSAGAALPHERHNAFWREFDNWALFHVRPETSQAIGVIFDLAPRWAGFARGTVPESAWVADVNQPVSRAAIERIAVRLMQTVEAHYGNPVAGLTLLESFELFGKGERGGLSPDPLRPADPQHSMNGAQMWFNWCVLLDCCIRLTPPVQPTFYSAMMRAVMLGLMNDGLFRERFPVIGFSKDDPNASAALRQHVLSIPDDMLDEELTRRFRDTSFALPFGG